MPYFRKKRFARRVGARRYPASRRPYRRSFGRKFNTRRRMPNRYVTRPVTRKQILNVTALKKSDNMVQTFTAQGAFSPTEGVQTISGITHSLWCCTARNSLPPETDNERMASRTFSVGFKENMQIDINGPTSWYWRRIVFSVKGGEDAPYGGNTPNTGDATFARFATTGITRNFNTLSLGGISALHALLFQGTVVQDWTDPRIATVDRTRVTLHSDQIRNLKSGNDSPHSHTYRQWYPIRKNIVYDDEEAGDSKTSSAYSVTSRISYGDVYIYDLFVPESPEPDDLNRNSNSTYYWHER